MKSILQCVLTGVPNDSGGNNRDYGLTRRTRLLSLSPI